MPEFYIGFGLVSTSLMKEIKSEQVKQWAFEIIFVPFGLPKILLWIQMDFFGIFKKNFRRS